MCLSIIITSIWYLNRKKNTTQTFNTPGVYKAAYYKNLRAILGVDDADMNVSEITTSGQIHYQDTLQDNSAFFKVQINHGKHKHTIFYSAPITTKWSKTYKTFNITLSDINIGIKKGDEISIVLISSYAECTINVKNPIMEFTGTA